MSDPAEKAIVADLLAAEFKLAAILRLMREDVPSEEWAEVIKMAADLLRSDPPIRTLLDNARKRMELPPG